MFPEEMKTMPGEIAIGAIPRSKSQAGCSELGDG